MKCWTVLNLMKLVGFLCALCSVYILSTPLFLYVPLEELMHLVFYCMPGQRYRRRLRSLLLCLCDVFRALINSLVY